MKIIFFRFCMCFFMLFSFSALASVSAEKHPILAKAIKNHSKIADKYKDLPAGLQKKIKERVAKFRENHKADKSVRSIADYHCVSDQAFDATGLLDLGTNGADVGYTQTELFRDDVQSGVAYTVECQIPEAVTDEAGYYYTRTPLTEVDDTGTNFYRVSDFLAIKMKIYVTDGKKTIPFDAVPGNDNITVTHDAGTFFTDIFPGGDTTFVFRIDEAIDSTQYYSGEVFETYYKLGEPDTLNTSDITSRYFLNVTVVASTECEFAGGDTFTVDLGSVAASNLTDDGVPSGYSAVPLDLTISCLGYTPDELHYFAYSFDGDRVTGSDKFITTDNTSVGIGILDEEGNQITLGTDDAIAVAFDQNVGEVTYTPSFYPVHIAGEPDAVSGPYSATVVSTVTFP